MPVSAGPLWVFAALARRRRGSPRWRLQRQPSARCAPRIFHPLEPVVQALGAVETAVGAYAIVFGDWIAGLAIVLFYAAFSVFVANALVRGLPVASCGCFGKEDTPPTWIHIAITMLGMAAGVTAIVSPPGDVVEVVSGDANLLIFLAMTGIAFSFAYISLTTLPKTLGAARRP